MHHDQDDEKTRENEIVASLFQPLQIGGLTIRNRIFQTPAVTNFGTERRLATQRHADYYAARARGGVGMVIVESMAPHPTAGGSRMTMQLWNDEAIRPLATVAAAVKNEDAVVLAQLNHGGREHASMVSNRALVSSSPMRSTLRREYPYALTIAEIHEIARSFGDAARRLKAAGFDGVELNSAHGYLIHQFLSPHMNDRTDDYGGDEASRMRFGRQVLEEMLAHQTPDFVVGVRISAADYLPNSVDPDFSRRVALAYQEAGADYISLSAGAYSAIERVIPDGIYGVAPNVSSFRGFRDVLSVPTLGAGRFKEFEAASSAVESGLLDMVGMARELMADPEIVNKWRTGHTDRVRPCIGCNQGCADRLTLNIEITCTQNPGVGFEGVINATQSAPRSRRIVVVGGGVAGLEAACTANGLGQNVVLLERDLEVGGRIRDYCDSDLRPEFGELIRPRALELADAGVDIRLGTTANLETVLALNPDLVIVATGAREEALPADNVMLPQHALREPLSGHLRVVVYDAEDHYQAAIVAYALREHGHDVTLVAQHPEIARAASAHSKAAVRSALRKAGVKMYGGLTWKRSTSSGQVFSDIYNQIEQEITADLFVPVGFRVARNELAADLRRNGVLAEVVGDARAPRQCLDAVREGRRAVLECATPNKSQ